MSDIKWIMDYPMLKANEFFLDLLIKKMYVCTLRKINIMLFGRKKEKTQLLLR